MTRRNFIKKGALFVPTLFVPRLIRAFPANCNPAFFQAKPPAAGGGGGSAYSLIASTSISENNSSQSQVTAGINTTGATLIVAAASAYVGEPDGGYTEAISDSKGNTWVALSQYGSGSGARNFAKLFYCLAPATDASHTFQITTGSYPCIAVLAFSGGDTHAFHTSTGAALSVSIKQPGAITAAVGELLVTACADWAGSSLSVNSGFTKQEQPTGAGSTLGLAFLSVGSAGSVNPTWTASVGDGGLAMAGFK